MNRANFLSALRRGLAGLPQSEVDEIASDYEAHFADGVAHGRSEDEVAAALGDPARLARELRAEVGFKRWEQDRSAGNFIGVVLALLGLATLDIVILFPILCALAGVFLGLSIVCLALTVVGIYLLFNLLPLGWHHAVNNALFQTVAGLGLFSGGIGGGALLLMLLDWVARLLVRYARLHYRLLTSANESI